MREYSNVNSIYVIDNAYSMHVSFNKELIKIRN